MNRKYQMLLRELYPTKRAIATEIVNLNAILSLPKPTEHFVSDLHGEYDAFQHVLRNGSGNVKSKIDYLFSTNCSKEELQELTTLVYYPEEKMNQIKTIFKDKHSYSDWYKKTLKRLIELCTFSSKRYTRSKVRKAFPPDFAYIIEELLFHSDEYKDKHPYYKKIFTTVLELDQDVDLIITICYLIQRFVVDHLHVLGDIFDRGPYPDRIIDTLIDYHSVDIQWGNHDILWMGASRGVPVLIANVVRICARYNNLDILEDQYGINLLPLLNFAQANYQTSSIFSPKEVRKQSDLEIEQVTKMHHAISVLQFKLEGQIIQRRPEFNLNERNMLSSINFEKNIIKIRGRDYSLIDTQFPTILFIGSRRYSVSHKKV